ncbi:MAG: formate dehydrogenase accessory sulfurtransferase FdhD [Acidobacteria bacterium]|nr:formate dehydrogenase accessory sulfurtransferase FdhD [Acidobacteriota bacterium]
MPDELRRVKTVRLSSSRAEAGEDLAAAEEPLEVRLDGKPFSVIMRTPGADRELAAGFLFAERVVTSADDLARIEPARAKALLVGRPPPNIVNVRLAAERAARLDEILAGRRQVTTNSSCGLCGRVTIASLKVEAPAVRAVWQISPDFVVALPGRLGTCQRVFHKTGGLHAAGLFHRNGDLVELAEDVGRHNAVDKVVGRLLLAKQLPAGDHVLLVSGRASFEIVQPRAES